MITLKESGISANQASSSRSVSISLSQATRRFEVGMLRDASNGIMNWRWLNFDSQRMLDRELNDLKAGPQSRNLISCFVVLWEAAKIGTFLLWCLRHKAQFGHKPGNRTLKMDHCTGRQFLH